MPHFSYYSSGHLNDNQQNTPAESAMVRELITNVQKVQGIVLTILTNAPCDDAYVQMSENVDTDIVPYRIATKDPKQGKGKGKQSKPRRNLILSQTQNQIYVVTSTSFTDILSVTFTRTVNLTMKMKPAKSKATYSFRRPLFVPE